MPMINSVKEATAAQSACLTAKVTLLAGGGYSLQNAGTVKARRTARDKIGSEVGWRTAFRS